MRNNAKRRLLALIGALALAVGLLPAQALAATGDGYALDRAATPEEYMSYQAVLDELGVEYGTTTKLLPLAECEARGLPQPKAMTPAGIELYRETSRERIVRYETQSLEIQLAWIDAFLDPEVGTYPDAYVPEQYCVNASDWGVRMMIDIIAREGYGEDVVRFVAGRNPAFAAAVAQLGTTQVATRIAARGPQTDLESLAEGQQQTRARYYVTHTVSPGMGSSKLSGYVNNASGSWKWDPASSATWVPRAFYPSFSAISYSLSGSYSATCTVSYYGVVTEYDMRFDLYTQYYTYLNASHNASAAA